MDSSANVDSSQYDKIGGWLILLGIGIVTNPLRLIFTTYSMFSDIFLSDFWSSLSSTDSIYYHKLWKPVIFFELSINIVAIIFSLIILIFFFKKSKFFPKTWIIFACTYILFLIIDLLLCRQIPFVVEQGMGDFYKPIIQNFVTFTIWGTYLIKSKRVKGTFIK